MNKMKFGIVVFPGSNCDHDAYYAITGNLGFQAEYLWHKDTLIPDDIGCVILPGGFSFGDYLRSGAIARVSPIIKEVVKFADRGGYVMGICNGFQTLCETGLLPGTLMRNQNLKFICKDVNLKVGRTDTPFTNKAVENEVLRIPVAHGEGNYIADDDTIKMLEDENLVLFRYCNQDGEITQEANPNGAMRNIAGIINKSGNVMGMMPHPERYSDKLLGCSDGQTIIRSVGSLIN